MVKLWFLLLFFVTGDCYVLDPGPLFLPTKGGLVPLPENQTISEDYFVVRPLLFEFAATDKSCSILEKAFNRYWDILNQMALQYLSPLDKQDNEIYRKLKHYKVQPKDEKFKAFLDVLSVKVTDECDDDQLPYYQMSESYSLSIQEDGFVLEASSVWGALRGLETFSQLVHFSDDTITLIVNSTTIQDRPRYSHRGLLLDTSRHFIPKKQILETLDAMAYNKLNVFHWHITDDQSFPYKSVKFPNMSDLGAYHPISKVYEQYDISEIIAYAKDRGIRVLPEFDTPGHTRSWGEAIKGLLTACYSDSKPTGKYGPIDPTKDSTYEFLHEFFDEVVKVFPDKYLHLGGDEVGFECWESNPDITEFMKQLNITGDYTELETFYIQKLVNIVKDLGSNFIVWEEVFNNGVTIPEETIVHVWIGDNYEDTLANVTKDGKQTILSACYYLDHLSSGGDWIKYYICNPSNFNGTDEQKNLVIGGEAAMWSEVVNEYNLISRVWPRTSAVAERLWSINPPDLGIDPNESLNIIQIYLEGRMTDELFRVATRLEEHTCRMNLRGIAAEPPSGPGVCL